MNGYVCFYKSRRIEVYAETLFQAKAEAVRQFKARKPWDVTVVLAETDGAPVVHSGAELPGA